MINPPDKIKVGLFVTCLVDLWRPTVGFAAVKLLQAAGCRVEVPEVQTCCGQPALNNGDDASAKNLAVRLIAAFEQYDYVVVPSGSCAGMIKVHYSALFKKDPGWHSRAESLAQRCYEILSFLHDVLKIVPPQGRCQSIATYHDGCQGLRELGIKHQPRELLTGFKELRLRELKEPEACCGFGGTFCVKYPDLSGRLVDDKVKDIAQTGADILLAGEMGCLLNIAGRLRRLGNPVRCFHTVEFLTGMADRAALGEGMDG